MSVRKTSTLARIFAFACSGLALSIPAHALTFTVTWGNDGTTGNFTATQQATIQNSLNTIASTYFDNVDVKLHIMNSAQGLGGSSQNIYLANYATYRNALIADKKSALDVTATNSLGATDPFGNRGVGFTSALGRALGLNTAAATTDGAGTFDCRIFLNAGICFTGTPVAGKYDLGGVALHEIDESMGVGGPGSLIGSGLIGNYVGDEDLFRYKANGVRTDLNSNSVGNYFSVDGGATNIRTFNNGAFGGDYADWASDGNIYAQNAFGTPGAAVSYSSKEISAADAVGWDVTAAPEPASLAVLGIGALGFFRRRKKS